MSRLAKHAAPSNQRRTLTLTVLVVGALVAAAIAWAVNRDTDDDDGQRPLDAAAGATTTAPEEDSTESSATTSGTLPAFDGWVNPALVGRPWSDESAGIFTFRGGPTRSYYGQGPVPEQPQVLWSFPDTGGMCSVSHDQHGDRTWCGTGWTGQPSVWTDKNGLTWVVFGAYDAKFHFLNGQTGARILPDFTTGDLAKGSVSVDPEGYPLLYAGSRDNYYRIIAMDREEPTELWRLSADAVSPTKWNNDWDGAALIIDDYLFEGGENSQWFVIKLNRGYDASGKVTVDPQVVFHAPGWDEELLGDIGDSEVSIENSVAISGNTIYFANSGGLVQGWDISGVKQGQAPTRVFRFWTGDDTDASIVIDEEGMLYVASEYERSTTRSREVGQLMKLDPAKPDDPLLWSIPDHDVNPAGMWATPALHKDVVYAATNGGRLLGIDRATGAIRWTKKLPGPTWQSPVVVDDVLIEGDCDGVLHGYDVSDTTVDPPELWTVTLSGCIESTPSVFGGRIYVGGRGGAFYGIGDA
jgi:hypothetical protein